jgi:hypothetical protein
VAAAVHPAIAAAAHRAGLAESTSLGRAEVCFDLHFDRGADPTGDDVDRLRAELGRDGLAVVAERMRGGVRVFTVGPAGGAAAGTAGTAEVDQAMAVLAAALDAEPGDLVNGLRALAERLTRATGRAGVALHERDRARRELAEAHGLLDDALTGPPAPRTRPTSIPDKIRCLVERLDAARRAGAAREEGT